MKKSKIEEFKKFKNLEHIEVESSQEVELINQIIQNIEVRKELKDRLKANKREKEIVFYTDGSLSREGTRDKSIIGYSIVQIDNTNNVVFRYEGRIENWFLSTQAELIACLVVTLLVPNKYIVEIRTDSTCAILAIKKYFKKEKVHEWLKFKNNNILHIIKKVCQSKAVQLRFKRSKATQEILVMTQQILQRRKNHTKPMLLN